MFLSLTKNPFCLKRYFSRKKKEIKFPKQAQDYENAQLLKEKRNKISLVPEQAQDSENVWLLKDKKQNFLGA